MSGPRAARGSFAIAVLTLLLGASGCAGNFGAEDSFGTAGDRDGIGSVRSDGAIVSDQDAAAIAQLAKIAARDAAPEGPVEKTECWAPSQNPVQGTDAGGAADEAGFRVLCRVHFEQEGAVRYRDMICIGNLGRDPVAEYCYQWAYYADVPKFEDRPAFVAPVSG